jgi:hypothetical protein
MKDSVPNPVKKKKSNNYIDNKKFYTEMLFIVACVKKQLQLENLDLLYQDT